MFNMDNINVDLGTVPTNSEVSLPRFTIMRQRCIQVFQIWGSSAPLLEKYCIVLYCVESWKNY